MALEYYTVPWQQNWDQKSWDQKSYWDKIGDLFTVGKYWPYDKIITLFGEEHGKVYAEQLGVDPDDTHLIAEKRRELDRIKKNEEKNAKAAQVEAERVAKAQADEAKREAEQAKQEAERVATAERAKQEAIKARENRLAGLSTSEAYENILKELRYQSDALKNAGLYEKVWRPGADTDLVIENMASRLAESGVKTIRDLQLGTVPGEPQIIGADNEHVVYGPGPDRQALINTRTGQEIAPQYAFADIGGGGSTWGGTFAGPGSTRYTINFVNGVPVFGAQQQATVKSGLEKIAPSIAGALATYLSAGTLGPVVAGALGGATSGLLSTGEIEGALKGAALGGAGGYVSGLIGGAPISESLPTSFGPGMGFEDVITASQAADLAGLAGISPEIAASNLGLLEASMGNLSSVIPPDVAASNLGLLEASMGPSMVPQFPTNLPGVPDLRLDVMPQPPAQPALGNLDKSMLLSDAGYGGMGPTQWWETITPGDAASTLGQIEGSMGGFVGPTLPTDFVGPRLPTGNADKAVLLGNEGYGPMSDLTVNQAPITSSPITSLGPSANLKDVVDYITGGGAATVIGNQLMDQIKGLIGGGGTTTQQPSGFGSLASTALGALLANRGQAAPQAGVSAGKAPDIVGPVASLLAPKLVQRQPISLL